MNILLKNNVLSNISFIFKIIIRNLCRKQYLKMFGISNNNISAIYVINLDRQNKRWRQIKKEIQFQKVNKYTSLQKYCHRISAFDGKIINLTDIDPSIINRFYLLNHQYYVDPDQRLLEILKRKDVSISMSNEEIAVALSHLKCWKKIIDDNIPYALILEDDIFFEGNFSVKLNRIWNELPSYRMGLDMLYLSFREVDNGGEFNYISEDIIQPKRGIWQLSGYVLSFSGAEKLLNELPICGPIDLWLNHKFSKINVYCSKKPIIFQRTDLKSDNKYSILPILSQIGIQSDKTLIKLEQKKGRTPIFIISNTQKNINILGLILSILGYRCYINTSNGLSVNIEKIIINNEPLLFDVYIGFNSLAYHYDKLKKLYPNAVFIWLKNEKICYKLPYKRNDYIIDLKEKNIINNLCHLLNCVPIDISIREIEAYSDDIEYTNIEKAREMIIDNRQIEILEHDVHPWIIPIEKLSSYGVLENRRIARVIGSYTKIICDTFMTLDRINWSIMEDTFPSNLSYFKRTNVSITEKNELRLTLKNEKYLSKEYSSASIETNRYFRYGRYEVTMKPAKGNGLISAFFLHRNDPWQEIDLEILGKDTTKILINVYYNPGIDGIKNNYGNRGTPILINLGFDASSDYHKYSVEWEPHEIRWYVDNILVYIRAIWEPTPIPDLPMKFYVNIWASKSEELADKINEEDLPSDALLKEINIYDWSNKERE
jgi:GR25 family glycosyltransferase involved in LPS biosynthesis